MPSPSPDDDGPDLVVDALLLDMDGTLIDSGPAVQRCWNQLFAELGSERRFDHSLHGVPGREVLARVFPHFDAEQTRTAFERVLSLELSDIDGIRVLPGTERLLAELDAASALLGRPAWTIVTSCTADLFAARWATTGLPVPPSLVTADQVARGKPDPEPYLLGARRLRVDPARTLVVEDSLGGLASARAAGARTLALATTSPAAELAGGADALVADLEGVRVRAHEGGLRVELGV
ncbi:HAD-IA family hydrolase [Brachybacterium hainanense]|uniref:HAD-IA family hydrolase n=1 Tax=Brachybacterium hainanense TaxID=1541174 RepID=A0ABV6REW9_9MICO